METPSPGTKPPPPAAPANGLKLMLLTLLLFGAVALFGLWQKSQRPRVEKFNIISASNLSPSPSSKAGQP